ncbi:copper chaperone PCu(A)C [Thalassotalea atypica]|uniref:copper chaperone PCu(A)C n=1 Tax=Thalassotalea atypica TaxID=2054316 RepID=UPI0025735604|nr:copper chaperone PCu(A)C [Thalassotalea atypica]
MKSIFRGLLAITFALCSINIAAQSISIEDGYVREVIPGNTMTSAYMVINNDNVESISLIGASANASPRVEIHAHSMEAGMMKMRQLDSIQVKGKQSVTLQPMGFHLMMFDLAKPLKAGERIEMTLKFSGGKDVKVTLPVKSIKQKKKHHHH